MIDEIEEEAGDNYDAALGVLKSHSAMINEHFDTVQIFATRSIKGKDVTMSVNYGAGNWFARYGQVIDWLEGVGMDRANEE